MSAWKPCACGLLLLAAGCRTDPGTVLVERELRQQEDEIYRLREVIRDYQMALESCQAENAALCQQLGRTPAGAPAEGPSPPASPAPGGPPIETPLRPPAVELPGAELPGTAPPEGPAEPPLPGPNSSSRSPAGGIEEPGEPPTGPHLGDAAGGRTMPASGFVPLARADSSQVEQIVLSRAGSGGQDADGQPGDEGITLVVEPRDARGRPLEAPADVAVVVLDPAEQGEAARVARWDFTRDQTAGLFEPSGQGRAMKLRMTWPGKPPAHNDLHLFLRYTTADGRALKLDQPIRVALPGEQAARWTPARDLLARGAPSPSAGAAGRAAGSAAPSAGPPPQVAGRSAPSSPGPAAPPPRRPTWSPNRP
jgi:hypothetical protein